MALILRKKRYQQQVSTKCGLELTGVVLEVIRAAEKEKKEKEEIASAKKIAAAEKKAEKETQAADKKKKKRSRDAVNDDADHDDDDDDKENRNPSSASPISSTNTAKKQKQQSISTQPCSSIQRQSSLVLPDVGPMMISIHTPVRFTNTHSSTDDRLVLRRMR